MHRDTILSLCDRIDRTAARYERGLSSRGRWFWLGVAILTLAFVLSCEGCANQNALAQAGRECAIHDGYATLVKTHGMTPDQLERAILASRKAWYAQRAVLDQSAPLAPAEDQP